jgi:integrase
MKTLKEPLTKQEEDKLLGACGNFFEKALLLVLLDTGMHVSVIPSLQLENIKEDRLQWHRPKKTGEDAVVSVPLSKRLKPIIQEFISQIDRTKDRWDYWKMIKDIAQRADLKNVSPMSCRHTFGVKMCGLVPGRAVKQLLGVKNERTVDRYTKYKDAMIDDMLKNKGW